MVRILLDTHVRLRAEELDERLDRSIRKALQFPNPEKLVAKREHVWGWEQMPDEVKLWRYEEASGRRWLVLPRGFFARLVNGLERAGYEWELDDARVEEHRTWNLEGALQEIALDVRRGQPAAAEALLLHEQGMLMAPPGMGKTQTALEVIRRAKQRTLIVVETTHIAGQWRQRALDFLGVELGLMGDSSWEERDITVALRQSLWSRRETLERDGFFERWGMVVFDECHHVKAMALSEIAQLFAARYRVGLSATPDRNDGNYPVVTSVLGEVVHEVSKLQLQNSGVLVRPSVTVVDTDFSFAFRPTRVENGRRHGNNWHQLVKKLIADEERNALVADEIVKRWPDRQLVLSKRLDHLDALRTAVIARGYPERAALMMTGAQDSEDRLRAARFADREPCVIFSTVADEALDVPRMEVVHLPFPTSNQAIVQQQVGRVERSAEGKTRAEVVDYCDPVGVLRRQFRNRMAAYRAAGYEISGVAR